MSTDRTRSALNDSRRTSRLGFLTAGFLALSAGSGEAACRLALAPGLDVSDSVDATKYRLQLGGLASALLHPEVQRTFLAVPTAPVRLFVFEWAGYGTQRRIID